MPLPTIALLRYWLITCLLSLTLSANAQPPQVQALPAAQTGHLQVPIFKSRILHTPRQVKKISIGNPDIADILIMQANQLYVLGRALGSTNVLLWDGQNKLIESLDLEVTHDLNLLKNKLHQVLPNEPISVFSAQGALVLRGQVSSLAAQETALQLAKSFAAQSTSVVQGKSEEASQPPSETLEVINLLSIGGSQQIMLEVKVAEMQRTLVKRLGVRFNAIGNNGNWNFGSFNQGAGTGIGAGGIGLPVGSLVGSGSGFLARFASESFLLNMVLEAAKDNGTAKILAEPTLTTLTGQEAQFISGGEFPIPVPNEDGITIEFKEFGVGVKFLPVLLDSGRINLKLNVSVSELSNNNSLVLGSGATTLIGNDVTQLIPALTKRSAESTVELGNGQTIGIAGLINESTRDYVSRFPGLGDVPVLGHLFRSQEFIHGETELVILVTPHLAKPLDSRAVQLPTANFVEPSDSDFYLLGKTKGRDGARPVPASLGIPEGTFGQTLQ